MNLAEISYISLTCYVKHKTRNEKSVNNKFGTNDTTFIWIFFPDRIIVLINTIESHNDGKMDTVKG